MAAVLVIAFVLLVLIAALLRLRGRRRLSSWLLAGVSVVPCVFAAADLARGASRIGQSAYQSEWKQLGFFLVIPVLCLVSASSPRRGWLFWPAWILAVLACAGLVYLAFFWKVFA